MRVPIIGMGGADNRFMPIIGNLRYIQNDGRQIYIYIQDLANSYRNMYIGVLPPITIKL